MKVGPERRPQLLDPRRLVGRVVRRHQRLGHLVGRGRGGPRPRATRSRPTACSTCSSARSCRSSTSAPRARCRAGGSSRVKHELVSLGPKVTASRMVRDYVTDLYEPAAARCRSHGGRRRHTAAKALAAWKQRVLAGWGGVRITGVIGRHRLTAELVHRAHGVGVGGPRPLEPVGRGRPAPPRPRRPGRRAGEPPGDHPRSYGGAGSDGAAGLRGRLRLRRRRALRLHRAGAAASRRPGQPGGAAAASSGRADHSPAYHVGARAEAVDPCGFPRGDADAVRAVYREYGGLVYAVAHKVLGDRALAEDATQQAFVQAWQAAASFDPSARARPVAGHDRPPGRHRRPPPRSRAARPEPLEDVAPAHPAVVTLPPVGRAGLRRVGGAPGHRGAAPTTSARSCACSTSRG